MNRLSSLSKSSRGLILLILLMVPSLLSEVPFNTVMGEPSEGNISFQPSEMPNLTFDYNVEEYRFELTWKEHYLHLEPFAIYNNQTLEFEQIIPWIKNNYPQVNYTWAVTKFKKYHRWGYWLENLPQNVADNLDYLGFRLDYNFPLSAVDIEWIETLNYTFPRIQLGKAITLDFADLYEHGFTLEVNKTHMMIGNVKGKTDLDLDPITYSSPTITVTGYTEEAPCTFWDVWNASNVNGWDVVHNNNGTSTQFQFDCKLVIGDGGSATFLTDAGKQIIFADGIVTGDTQHLIDVKGNAIVNIGTVIDALEKTCESGCSIMSLESTFHSTNIFHSSGGVYNLYASHFYAPSIRHYVKNVRGNIWSTIFSSFVSPYASSTIDADLYDCTISASTYGVLLWAHNLEDVKIYGCTHGGIHAEGVNPLTVRDITLRNCTFAIRLWNYDVDMSLIDCDLDVWSINFAGGCDGHIIRQHTFNLAIVDVNGLALENVDVSLTYSGQGGGTVGIWETGVNGSIPEQTLSKGFYNQTGGDTIYLYEPYNLTISMIGYDTESFIFNITEPTSWVIGLRENVIDVEVNTSIGILPVLLGFMGLVVILAARRRR